MAERLKLTPAQQAAGIDRAGESLALRSGAGCGKTFVLARRFTELLLMGGAKNLDEALSRFVALTFTDKAALEMSQRVRAMMRDFAARATGQDKRRLQGWIERLGEARISTIHSFCASLLRGLAIEAGLDPAFAVCGDTFVTDKLLAEAAELAVLWAVEAGDEAVAALLGAMSLESFSREVRDLTSLRDAVNFDDYDDPQITIERWAKAMERLRGLAQQRLGGDAQLREKLTELESFICTNDGDKLLPIRDDVLDIARQIISQPLADSAELFDELAKQKPGTKGSGKSWGDKDTAKAVRHCIKDLCGALGEYAVFAGLLNEHDQTAARTLATLCRLAGQTNERYAAEKKSRGIVDFTDLMTCARDVLAENPALRARLGEGIDQLLIDEAQDTDPTQLSMLLGLLDSRSGGGLTDGQSGGKLFLVGDAKQSIYRFRGARLEVFQQLCDRLGPGRQIDLDISFRTLGPGLAFVNHVFSQLLGDDYSPVRSSRAELPAGPSVEILLANGPEDRPVESAQAADVAQAEMTAQRISQMVSRSEKRVWDAETEQFRPVRYGDIAILFARMTNSLVYERELQKRDIPYYVVSGTGFFRQQEIFDCLNALRVIDNPRDDLALVGLLRSAMFGLDDNALLHIASHVPKPWLPNMDEARLGELARLMKPGQAEALQLARDMLQKLSAEKDALGCDKLLERVLAETSYEAVLLSQYHGRRMVGNVRLLLSQARQSAGQMSLAEFVEQMDEQILNESRYEQAPAAGEGDDAVQLITIHKAKGLEYPVAFVPDLNAGKQPIKAATLHRLDMGLVTKIRPGSLADDDESNDDDDEQSQMADLKDQPLPRSFAMARWLENRDQQRETLRKYYVALTRAEDYLVLVAANWRTKDGALRSRESFLARLDEVLDIDGALQQGGGEIRYRDDGQEFVATVSCQTPRQAHWRAGKSKTPGETLICQACDAEGLAAGMGEIAANAKGELPLLGPVSCQAGQVELAATALDEFAKCPAMYHWRYELRAPVPNFSGLSEVGPGQVGDDSSGKPGPGWAGAVPQLDPLTLGTLLHGCMELVDFANPQQANVLLAQGLARTGLGEEVGDFDLDALAEELEAMLAKFRSGSLARQLARLDPRDIYRELDFVSAFGPATIRGQIDLLYQACGQWHIVDYKSDHVSGDADSLAAKASRYEMQMLIYAQAVARYTGLAPAGATLYFLRTGQEHSFDISPQAIADATGRVEALARELVDSRRAGKFKKCNQTSCDYCRIF